MKVSLSSLRIKLPEKQLKKQKQEPAVVEDEAPAVHLAGLATNLPEKMRTNFEEQLEQQEPTLNKKIFENCGMTIDELIAQVNSSGDVRENRVQANKTKDGYQIFIFREKECYLPEKDNTTGRSKFIKNRAFLISINSNSQVSFKKIVTLAQKSPLFQFDLKRKIDAKLIASGYQTATKLRKESLEKITFYFMDDKGTDLFTHFNRLLEDDNYAQIEHDTLAMLKAGIEWQIQTNYSIYDQKLDNFCRDEKTGVIEPIDYDEMTYSKNIPHYLSLLLSEEVNGKFVLSSPIIRVTELFMVYYETFKSLLYFKIDEAYCNMRNLIETYKETNKEFYLYGNQAMELLAIHIMFLNHTDESPHLTLETWTKIEAAIATGEIISQENLGPYFYD